MPIFQGKSSNGNTFLSNIATQETHIEQKMSNLKRSKYVLLFSFQAWHMFPQEGKEAAVHVSLRFSTGVQGSFLFASQSRLIKCNYNRFSCTLFHLFTGASPTILENWTVLHYPLLSRKTTQLKQQEFQAKNLTWNTL